MQGAPVGTAEGRGDALLSFEDAAQGGPTGVLAGLPQAGAEHLHQLVGDDGDEQVAFGAEGLVVVDGTQAEFGFQRAEHGFDIGEHEAGAPEGVLVPVGFAAAQAVHAGVGHHGAGSGVAGEAHGGGALAGGVGVHGDVVMLGDAVAVFLESSDALVDLVDAFAGARFGEALGELGEGGLEALGEALGDALFLGGAGLGVAVQAHFLSVLIEHALQLHAVA